VRLMVKMLGAFVVVVVSFFATLWAMNYFWPSCPTGNVTVLKRPYDKFSVPGFGYTKELPKDIPGDLPGTAMQSTLLVCENNNLLGPMRAAHAEIAKDGRGRYSHWGVHLVFSTSDNSDPNTNGRSYSVVQPR
jgi:hypothetical protein